MTEFIPMTLIMKMKKGLCITNNDNNGLYCEMSKQVFTAL